MTTQSTNSNHRDSSQAAVRRPGGRNDIRKLVVGLCVASFALPAFGGDFAESLVETPMAPAGDEWEFDLGLYGWGTAIKGTTAGGTNIDMDLEDILDNLKMTFMGAAGVRKGKWALGTDLIYLDMEQDVNRPVIDKIGLTTWIVGPTLSYTVAEDNWGKIDAFVGARYLDLETEVTRNNLMGGQTTASTSGSVWDGIVGVQGQVNLSERWYMPYRFDVGTGESDITWQVLVGIGYHFSKCDAILSYRYLKWEVGESAIDNLEVGGPMIGVRFGF